MGECSAIFFCVCSQNELSRFQAVLSFFMSYFSNIIILEKLSEHIFFYLFFRQFSLFCDTFSIFVYLPGDLVVGVRFGSDANITFSTPIFLPKLLTQRRRVQFDP
jgi:hypothetical protein